MLRKLTCSYNDQGKMAFVYYRTVKRKKDGQWVWKKDKVLSIDTINAAFGCYYEDYIRQGHSLSKKDRELIETIELLKGDKDSLEVYHTLMGGKKNELSMVDWDNVI